jgi:curved DNA-binding protein CbpA
MTNLFALLEESPRPWLDADALKAKYHDLTARHHPDVAGNSSDFAEINRAYQTLADPGARLRHLIDLESPGTLSRSQPVPDDIAIFFTPVAEVTHAVEAFLKKQSSTSSPLAKALLSKEQYQLQEKLEEVISILHQKHESLLARLSEADALWFTDRPAALQLLPALWQSFGYLSKWLANLRESLFRLASL